MSITAEQVRERLDYDAETGIFRWRSGPVAGSIAGTTKWNGYRAIYLCGSPRLAHRLAWLYVHGTWPEKHIDHINGDRTDNRIANLRDVTRLWNQQNRQRPQKGNVSGFLGVSLDRRRNLYVARIRVPDGKPYMRHIGSFKTPEEAHAAYVEAKRRLHAGCTI
jgi:hypothetical protein